MNKQIENQDQLFVEKLIKMERETLDIHQSLVPIIQRYRKLNKSVMELQQSKRLKMFDRILETIRRRMYFGSDFFPYFMMAELVRMHKELATIRETIENVMVETVPEIESKEE